MCDFLKVKMGGLSGTKPPPEQPEQAGRKALAGAAAAVASVLLFSGLHPRTAQAQGYTPIYTLDYGNPVVIGDGGEASGNTKPPQKLALATAFFPVAEFNRSGYFADRQGGGTDSVIGELVAGDLSVVPHSEKQMPIEAGGWYFVEKPTFSTSRYGSKYDLYELHVRAYVSPRRDIGFQAAVIRSTKVNFPGNEYTYFLVSDYSSARLRRQARNKWGVQVGAGILVDPNYNPTGGGTTADPTFFLSGSLDLGKRFNVTLSEWYLRDREQDINRLALGFGYHF